MRSNSATILALTAFLTSAKAQYYDFYAREAEANNHMGYRGANAWASKRDVDGDFEEILAREAEAHPKSGTRTSQNSWVNNKREVGTDFEQILARAAEANPSIPGMILKGVGKVAKAILKREADDEGLFDEIYARELLEELYARGAEEHLNAREAGIATSAIKAVPGALHGTSNLVSSVKQQRQKRDAIEDPETFYYEY